MTSAFALIPLRGALLVGVLALAACSSLDNMVSGDKLDYRSQANKTQSLDIPPDLTQLARDGRYQPQSGVVSASTLRAAPAATTPVVALAPQASADLRIERQGNTRWLVTKLPPETLYPLLRSFWAERGFSLAEDNAAIGVMETTWAENRAKLPQDIVRQTLGRVLESLYSTGERDRFRTRVERTDSGSDVYISHRGLVEVYNSPQKESTVWQPRPSDPELEAEMLARLMVKLGAKDEVAARTTVAQAPAQAARTRVASMPDTASMELDEPFDRAWRRIGLSLDRSGFTVEDRDRTAGLYFVRYIDPKLAGKDEPGFFSRLLGGDKDVKPQRYRVLVKAAGSKSLVTVQNNLGAPDNSEPARQIIGRLIDDLR